MKTQDFETTLEAIRQANEVYAEALRFWFAAVDQMPTYRFVKIDDLPSGESGRPEPVAASPDNDSAPE